MIQPEVATLAEIEQRLATLLPEKTNAIRQHLQPIPLRPKPSRGWAVPIPAYASWEDYLATTAEAKRRKWCMIKAKKTNRERLISGRPEHRLTGYDVWK